MKVTFSSFHVSYSSVVFCVPNAKSIICILGQTSKVVLSMNYLIDFQINFMYKIIE